MHIQLGRVNILARGEWWTQRGVKSSGSYPWLHFISGKHLKI